MNKIKYLLVIYILISPISTWALTPLADYKNDISKLVLNGDIHKAKELIEQKIKENNEPVYESELIASRLILHELDGDYEGYSLAIKKYLPKISENIKKTTGERQTYIRELLLGSVSFGNTFYANKKEAQRVILNYERTLNSGTLIRGITYYRTITKSAVAYRFKDTDFAYDLLYRSNELLIEEDIRSPITQIAFMQYMRTLTYRICDLKEIELVFLKLNENKLLDVDNKTLIPHVKTALLGFLYDAGLLDGGQRQEIIEKIKHILKKIPTNDKINLSQLVNMKEANELLIKKVSDDDGLENYIKKLNWLTEDYSNLSEMAVGAKILFEIINGKDIDINILHKKIDKYEKFINVSSEDDMVFGFAQSIRMVFKSLVHYAQKNKELEIESLEQYIELVINHRKRQSTWVGYDINKDDFVQLTVSLYVSKRLAEINNNSKALAELNHYIVQSLALAKNEVQIKTAGLYKNITNDIDSDKIRGYLKLKSDRLKYHSRILDLVLSGKNKSNADNDVLNKLKLSTGLGDVHREILRSIKKIKELNSENYTYFTRIDELDFSDSVYIAHANVLAYGVSVSKRGNNYKSIFWTEKLINEQLNLKNKIVNRDIDLKVRNEYNKIFWKHIFKNLHSLRDESKVIFGSGATVFDLPVTLARDSDRWLIDYLKVKVYQSSKDAGDAVRNEINNKKLQKKSKFEFAFLGIGDPIVESSERLAAINNTEKLIRGKDINNYDLILQALPDTADELKAISSKADGPTFLALDKLANKRFLSNIDYSKIELTSFATHGVMSNESGLLSPSLLLSDFGNEKNSRFLTLDDINELVGVSPIVILSACNTATIDDSAKQAGFTSSLLEGFLARGAELVISSYWAVDSDATRKLMSNFSSLFYGNLSSKSTSDLFWTSIINIKSEKVDYLDWGAFVPTGDYFRPIGAEKSQSIKADRARIHDAIISNYSTSELLAIFSTDKLNNESFASGIEIFNILDDKLTFGLVAENAIVRSAKLINYRKDEIFAVWLDNFGKLRSTIININEKRFSNNCDLSMSNDNLIHDIVLHNGFIFLTTHSGSRAFTVRKIDPIACSHKSIIVNEPSLSNMKLIGVSIFGFDGNNPVALLLSYNGDSRKENYRFNKLGEKHYCSLSGGLVAVQLNWNDLSAKVSDNLLGGYTLTELISPEADSINRNIVYLRYSDTCDRRNHLIVGDINKISNWFFRGDPKKDRIPVKTWMEVEAKPTEFEASLNNEFSFLSGLRRLSASEDYLVIASSVMPVSSWYLSSVDDTLYRQDVRRLLGSSSFYITNSKGKIKKRVRSAIGCDGGFSFMSSSSRYAVVGCKLLSDDGIGLSKRVFLYNIN